MYKIELIETNNLLHFEGNPRFDPNIESGLLESIKNRGIRVPLLVSLNHNGKYDVIDGERRRACAVALNIPTVPCIIEEMDEETKWLEAFNLNEERASFSPMERANHFYRLKTKFLMSDEILSRNCSFQYTRQYISKLLALQKLPDEVQGYVHKRDLGVIPAYEISRLAFDVSFPSTGKFSPKDWVAKEKGRVWDFTWDKELKFKDWKENRTELQIDLAKRYRSKNIEQIGDQSLLEALRDIVSDKISAEEERREREGKIRKELEEKIVKAEEELTPIFKNHNEKMDEIIKKLEFEELKAFKVDIVSPPDDMREFARAFQKRINEKQPDKGRLRRIQEAKNTASDFRKSFQKKDPIIFELGEEVGKESVCDQCGHEVNEQILNEFIKTIGGKLQGIEELQTYITENRNNIAKELGNLSGSVNDLNDLRSELKELIEVGEEESEK